MTVGVYRDLDNVVYIKLRRGRVFASNWHDVQTLVSFDNNDTPMSISLSDVIVDGSIECLKSKGPPVCVQT